jgi:hypothetical protein
VRAVLAEVVVGLALLAVGYSMPPDLPRVPMLIAGAAVGTVALLTWLNEARKSKEAPGPPSQPSQNIQVGMGNINVQGNQNSITIIIQATDLTAEEVPTARMEEPPIDRTPRNDTELQHVLTERPPGWEYMYFTGNLILFRDALEEKYHDHELRYPAAKGERLDDDQALSYVQRALDDMRGHLDTFAALFEPAVMERAFGAPGHPGDPARIRKLAERLTGFYEAILDWSAHLRGVSKTATFRRIFELTARLPEKAARDYRAFVDDFARRLDESLPKVAAGEQVELQLMLTIDIDPDALAALNEEIERVSLALTGTSTDTYYDDLIVEGAGYGQRLSDGKVTTQTAKDLTDDIRGWQVRCAERASDAGQLAELLLNAGEQLPEWGVGLLQSGWRGRVRESIDRWVSALGKL